MDKKIINFNDTKAEFIRKKFPNISKKFSSDGKRAVYYETNKALEVFQEIFFAYQEYLNDKKNNKEVKLEEVMFYFNKFFDAIYKEMCTFDHSRVPKLKEAMDYVMLSSGKRIRPFLMLVAYNFAKGEDFFLISPLMVAIELIHNFSLIHDDLPCIDNDTLRRGKETVWKKFGEDIAVLTGDALMMQASTILLETIFQLNYSDLNSYMTASALVLMKLAGLEGMIVGETFDVINANNKNLTIEEICYMYDKKTTSLLTAALVIGSNMAGKISDKLSLIEKLGICLGESYQIKDDLLEIESTTEKIGKSVDSDKKNGKMTYVEKVGVKESKIRLGDLYAASMQIIDTLTNENNVKEAKVFKEVIDYLMSREK